MMAKSIKKTPERLMAEIISAVGGLGWSLAFDHKAKTIKYLIVGQDKEVRKILEKINGKAKRS
jgi:hypothetical protein